MPKSDRERGSELPDQSEEIKEREKRNKDNTPTTPPDDFPGKEVERDEKADEKGRKSIKDIEAGKEKVEDDNNGNRK